MRNLISLLLGLVIVCIAATSVSAAEYEVQRGDSLWKIANENNTTVELLMQINELNSTIIHPKQMLKLDTEDSEAEFYIVEEGDTLTHISNEYGDEVTVEKLKEWNNLSSDLILIGQSLNVNGKGVVRTAMKTLEQTSDEPVVVTNNNANKTEEKSNTNTTEEKVENKVETAVMSEATEADEIQGTTFAVEATAYTAGCTGCSGITATGIDLNNDPYAKVIAVDPSVIPLGTRVYVEGYGYAIAGDTGGAIKGNKIDIHVPTKEEAYNWGRRTVNITILE